MEQQSLRENETIVPNLPDDIYFIIFDELTTEERLPLGTSCKRFREIDFELGNKSFNDISIFWEPNFHHVEMSAVETQISIYGFRNYPIELSNHAKQLFRRAHTQSLNISIGTGKGSRIDLRYILVYIAIQMILAQHQGNLRNSACKGYDGSIGTDAALQMLINLASSVKYRKLGIYFSYNQDFSDNYIFPTLTKNRNLENTQVQLSFGSSCASNNIHRIREMIMRLPKIDVFRLKWVARSPVNHNHPDEHVHNDATLFHIALQTNHAALSIGDYTIQGIMNVFEDKLSNHCKGSIGTDPTLQLLTKFANSVKYQKLGFFFDSNQDFSDHYIFPALIKDRRLENIQVRLVYTSSCASHNIDRMRELIMRLPKIDVLGLHWEANRCIHSPSIYNHPDEQVLDDATLFHIAVQTNHAVLPQGGFTIQGIVNVFELVCKSDLGTKFIAFFANSSLIDDLFSSAITIGRTVERDPKTGNCWVVSFQHSTMMRVTFFDGMPFVDIYKIGYEGNKFFPKCRPITW